MPGSMTVSVNGKYVIRWRVCAWAVLAAAQLRTSLHYYWSPCGHL
jgi:hypothetical protein